MTRVSDALAKWLPPDRFRRGFISGTCRAQHWLLARAIKSAVTDRIRIGLVAIITLIGLPPCMVAGALAAQPESSPRVEFLRREPISVQLGSEPVRFGIIVRNTRPDSVPVRFALYVESSSGSLEPIPLVMDSAGTKRIPGLSVQGFRLLLKLPDSISGRAFSGYLTVAAGGGVTGPPDAIPFTATVESQTEEKPLVGPVFGWTLAAAALLVLGVGVVLWLQEIRPHHWMLGAPTWDFSQSWASTTTVAAVFLNSALAVLIDTTVNERLLALAAVFGILVVIAPLAYSSFVRTVLREAEEWREGPVAAYLLASLLTTWGVLGGLYTGYEFIRRVGWEGLTRDVSLRIFDAMPWLVLLLVAVYSGRTMYETVWRQVEARKSTIHAADAAASIRADAHAEPPRRAASMAFPLL